MLKNAVSTYTYKKQMESNLSLQGQALVAWLVSVAGRIPQLSCVNVCTEFCRNAIHADLGVLQLALFLAYVMDTIPCNFIVQIYIII